MFINKKNLRKTDVVLLVAVVAIVVMSLVIIGSATHINTPSEERYWFVQRQGIFALINVAIAVFLMNFDYKMLQGYGNKIYIFNLIMLLAVMFVGQSALGAQRWIQLGPVSIQPSEFSKIIMIIALANLLKDKIGKLNTFSDLLPIAAYVGLPFLLVLKQPDLGTSLVFMAIFFGMIFACGINLKLLAGIFSENKPETIEEKREFLHKNHIAVWDVIASCEIEGSSDSSIKNVVVNDFNSIIYKSNIKQIFCNGGKSYDLYRKYCEKSTNMKAIKLPSTSPANARFSLDKLISEWKIIEDYLK